MNFGKRSVHISPQKHSEIVPLLGEALLLYDVVVMDATLSRVFDVLAANIDIETMEQLLDSGSLKFVYDLAGPVVAKQTKETPNTILLINYVKSNINPFDTGMVEKTLKPYYPKSLIKKIKENTDSIKIDNLLWLENCYSDMESQSYVTSIFNFVKDSFGLADFGLEFSGNGCYFIPYTKDDNARRQIYEHATYGLHLIAETNYKMALLSLFDEVVCETEFEDFFVNKLRQTFRVNQYTFNSQNLLELCEINDFPDIKEVISSGLMTIKDVLILRKGDGQVLRSWLNNVTKTCINDNVRFSKECAKLLSKANKGLPLPARTIVFGLLQGLSFIKPIPAVALSAVNEFVVPRLVNEWQPRYFFDKAKKLQLKKVSTV